MNDVNSKLQSMKSTYREVFEKSSDAILARIEEIRPKDFNEDILTEYEPESVGAQWQKDVLDMLENDISHEIYDKWQEVLKYREEFHCKGCATCCNLACSEYSPEELSKRAENGDNFAKQFTSIFIPYNSKEEAQKVYPEYIELLDESGEKDVYFYHCPKLTCDKKCSDYENRPDICRHFPDNPLCILPKSCGFYEWREEVLPIVLMLHAMMEIIGYYKSKIKV